MNRSSGLALALTLLSSASAHAQTADSVYRLKPLIVQATTPFATNGGASALAVRPDSMRLAPAPTLERVLRELPFVQVRLNARGEGYFGLRGSGFDAREVAVLVDGLPVSLGFDHRADLSVLPATSAYTMTVVRGIPSLLYGPNVLGGVVEVGLADAGARNLETRASIGYDDAGTFSAHGASALSTKVASGTLLLRGGASYRGTDGFPLPADVQEPAPFAEEELRLNSDRIQRDGFLTARYESANGAWASLSGLGYSATRGTPAELNTTQPRFWRYPSLRRTFAIASAGTGQRASPLGGHTSIQGSFGYDMGHTELNGYTNRTYTTIADTESDDDKNLTGRLLATHSLGTRGDVSAALTFADVEREETIKAGTAAPVTSLYRQRLWSGALETGWRISAIRISGGLAYDASDTPASSDKPVVPQIETWGGRVGAVAVAADGDLLLHAGVARRARFPALRELYSGQLRMFEPNPNLKHEVLIASEAGATVQLGAVQVQSVVFHHQIKDQIVRTVTPAPARKVQRINRDQTHSTGIELLAATSFKGMTLGVDVTGQSVESTNPVTETDFRPEYQPKWSGGARLNAPLPLGLHTYLSTRVVGAQYCLNTAGAYVRLDRSTRADAELARAFRRFEVSVAGDNLTDRAIYDQCGLPQAGRVLRVQVRVR